MTSLTTPFKLSRVSHTTRVFSLLTLLTLYSDLATAEHRVALVIGNAAYEKSLLTNSINDAQDMAEVLKQVGFEVTILKNATQNNMETAIQTFGKQLGSGDVGLFYFAGHGVQYQGDNYLFPTDAIRTVTTPGHLRLKTVNVDYVLSVMEGAGNDLNIVILDTCRHNPFKELVRGINNDGRTLKAPSGSLIAYSTRPDAEAAEGTGRNSPYVKYLKKELRKPGLPIEQVLLKPNGNIRPVPARTLAIGGAMRLVLNRPIATGAEVSGITAKPRQFVHLQKVPLAYAT
jgi:Caspase domain